MFQDAHIRIVAKLVGIAAIIALLAYTYFAYVQARNIDHMPMSITIDGKGEVFAKPDIATFSFSVISKEADAVTAQSRAGEDMNKINEYLKGKGIEEKDIKTTGYYLNPRYEYPETVCTQWGCPPAGEPKLIGYEVSHSVDVKVRKTDDAGMLIAGVGELGATNVGGLNFTIDDEEKYKAEAREIAIADAKAKAQVLADELGVRIVRMNGYWEDQGMMPYYGMGGGAVMDMAMSKEANIVPQIPTGENTITSMVHITYEISGTRFGKR
jgi:uncharacterized protein YggE